MAFESLDTFGEETPVKEDKGSYGAGDFAKKFGAGAAEVGAGLGAGIRYFYNAGKSDNGAAIGKSIQDIFGALGDAAEGSMSPAAREGAAAAFTDPKFWENPALNTALKVTGMVPMVAASALPAGLVADGIWAARAAAGLGGAFNAGDVLNQIDKQVDGLSDEELQKQSPLYAGLRSAMDEKEARREYQSNVKGMKPALAFLIGAGANYIGPAANIVRGVKGEVGPGAAMGLVEGALGGGAQGASTEAMVQQAAIDGGLKDAMDLVKVAEAGIEGAVLGGAAGGVTGAVFGRKGRVKDDVRPVERGDGDPPRKDVPVSADAVEAIAPQQEGHTGSPVKPPEDAPVGNPKSAPTRSGKENAKKGTKAGKKAGAAEVVDEASPDAAQSVAIAADQPPKSPAEPATSPDAPAAPPAAETIPPQVLQASERVGQPEQGVASPEPVQPAVPEQLPEAVQLASERLAEPRPEKPALPQIEAPPAQADLPAKVTEASARVAADQSEQQQRLFKPEPARTGRVLERLDAPDLVDKTTVKGNLKAMAKEEAGPQGKNRTAAEKQKLADDTDAARGIFEEATREATVFPSTKAQRDQLRARVEAISRSADELGIKVPAKIYDTTPDHIVYLREVKDLAKRYASGKEPTAEHLLSFVSREKAAKGGDFSLMRAERRAEGDEKSRVTQGDVETKAEKPVGGGDVEKDAVVTAAAKSARGPVRGLDDASEKTVLVDKKGVVIDSAADRAKAASGVRKVELTPEMKAAAMAALNKAAARGATLNQRIDALAKAADTNPTEAQKKKGNYAHGHIKLDGLDISVENPKGSLRTGRDENGVRWQARVPDHYGYIKRTTGADGDHVDVFVGRDRKSDRVFVIDQLDTKTGAFDEHKVMLGYPDEATAIDTYKRAFTDGRADERVGNVVEMSKAEFKEWLKRGDTAEPASRTQASELEVRDLDTGDVIKAKAITPAKQVLAAIPFNHLTGVPAQLQPFIAKRLAEAAGDVPVHVVSPAEMAKLAGGEDVLGYFTRDVTAEGNEVRRLFVRSDLDQAQTLHVVVHETAHAATTSEINNSKLARDHIKLLMNHLAENVDLLDAEMNRKVGYSLTNEKEFIAEAFSNPALQDVMARIPISPEMAKELRLRRDEPQSLWGALISTVRSAMERVFGPLPGTFTLLEASMKVGERLVESRTRNDYARMEAAQKFAQFRERKQVRDSAALIESDALDSVKRMLGRETVNLQEQEKTPILLKISTMDNIAQRSDRFFGGADNNPVRKIANLVERIRVGGEERMKKAEPVIKKLADLQDKYKGTDKWEQFTSLVHDETMANAHADVGLDHPKNAHLGKDTLHGAQPKAWHPELYKRWQALPDDLKAARVEAMNFFTKQQNDMSLGIINNRILRALGINDDALAKRIHEDKTTDADAALLGPELLDTILDAKELSAIQGPYFPLMRRGEFVVQATKPLSIPAGAKAIEPNVFEFPTRKDALDHARSLDEKATVRSVWVDKTTGDRYGTNEDGTRQRITAEDVNAVQRFRVTVQDRHVEFFKTEREAQQAAADLEAQGFNTKGVEAKRYEPGGRSADMMSTQVKQLVSTLEKREGFKDLDAKQKNELIQTLNEVSIKFLGSTRIQSKRLPRRYVAGASMDLTQNTYDYAQSASRYLAKLQHQPDVEAAMKEMREAVGSNDSKNQTLARSQIANEVERRVTGENGYEQDTVLAPAIKRLMAASFIDKLASPAYSIMNATQVGMLTAPVLSGRHGVGRTVSMLARVYNDIGAGGIIKKGLQATGRALKGAETPDTLIGDIRARLTDANEQRMLDHLIEVGAIDPSAGMELGRMIKKQDGLGGKADAMLGYLEGVTRAMPRSIEAINRSVSALAAYRLERGRGGSHDQAVRYAQDIVNTTQFNYANTNAAPVMNHPLLKLSLQFKKYAQGTYQLLGSQIGKAVRNAEPGDRAEALKTLGAIAAAHGAMAGAFGLPTEPFKYLLLGANVLNITDTNWSDVEHAARRGISNVVGPTAAEAVTKGLPRLANIDVSSRAGLDTLLSFGSPRSNKEADIKSYLFENLAGAPASLLFDVGKGLNAFSGGEFQKAAELLVPVKFMSDSLRAYRQATEGKKSASGKETMSAYTPTEAAMRVLGFGSGREAETGAARSQFFSADQRMKDQRAALIKNWIEAKSTSKTNAWAKVQQWNKGKPADAQITMKDLTSAAKRREKDAEESTLGIKATKRNQHLVDDLGVYNTR